jgi:hypothetical protein
MFRYLFLSIFLLSLSLSAPCNSHAADIETAPTADLYYKIKSNQKGIPVSGEAKIQWRLSDSNSGKKTYTLSSDTTVTLFGKILTSSSKGYLDERGLVPEQFSEKRFRRPEAQITFDWANKRLSFSGGEASIPLKGREQDRLSIMWQVMALAKQAGSSISLGQEWKAVVAGPHDADWWTFKVQEKLTLRTDLGELEVIHILRAPPADAPGQRLELWLAPTLDYFPVRIRFIDSKGDQVEQTISRIQKLPSN